jgi:hypothetical protein
MSAQVGALGNRTLIDYRVALLFGYLSLFIPPFPLMWTLRLVSVQVFLCAPPAQQLLDRIHDRPQYCGAFPISFAQEFVSLLGRNDHSVLAMAFNDARRSAQYIGTSERARTRGHGWPLVRRA